MQEVCYAVRTVKGAFVGLLGGKLCVGSLPFCVMDIADARSVQNKYYEEWENPHESAVVVLTVSHVASDEIPDFADPE